MDDLRRMLEEEISDEIENLGNLEQGSEEHSEAVENIAKLYKLKLEEDRNEKETEKVKNDFEELKKQNEAAKALEEEKIKEAKIDRYCRIGVTLVSVALPLMVYGHWYKRGLKFEETGTLTSATLRGVISKFNPFK